MWRQYLRKSCELSKMITRSLWTWGTMNMKYNLCHRLGESSEGFHCLESIHWWCVLFAVHHVNSFHRCGYLISGRLSDKRVFHLLFLPWTVTPLSPPGGQAVSTPSTLCSQRYSCPKPIGHVYQECHRASMPTLVPSDVSWSQRWMWLCIPVSLVCLLFPNFWTWFSSFLLILWASWYPQHKFYLLTIAKIGIGYLQPRIRAESIYSYPKIQGSKYLAGKRKTWIY